MTKMENSKNVISFPSCPSSSAPNQWRLMRNWSLLATSCSCEGQGRKLTNKSATSGGLKHASHRMRISHGKTNVRHWRSRETCILGCQIGDRHPESCVYGQQATGAGCHGVKTKITAVWRLCRRSACTGYIGAHWLDHACGWQITWEGWNWSVQNKKGGWGRDGWRKAVDSI